MNPLPVDELLPEVVASLRRTPNLVIEAPPGAGKTTRVPPALLAEGVSGEGEIIVLEPRRLAARLAARRVAEERGERVGETFGYQVRFEDVSGPRTRVKFVTEGVLTRRLLSDPQLRGVSAVVLDEFHERHLQTDLALALLRRLQAGARKDLRIIVMSATLDAGPVSRYLGDCPRLRSEGRRFEVTIEHLSRHDERPVEALVRDAVGRLVREGLDGHVLVFLPGAASIRRAQEACARVAGDSDLLVLPLHGELPAEAQDLAVRPSEVRKLILSTNVAETSVTIEGVSAVVDTGLARVASHSPWSGLPVMRVERVSRASATQRAGRAGRTRGGLCLRLYTEQDFVLRPEYDTSEVRRLDLSEAVLELRAAGVDDLSSFDWFEPPPAGALEAADELLRKLGAVGAGGAVTELGRRMLRLPLHPRLSRLVIEADARGFGPDGCLLAALAGERDIRSRADLFKGGASVSTPVVHGDSDLLESYDLFAEARRAQFNPQSLRALSLDPNAVRAVARVASRLERSLQTDRRRGGAGGGLDDEGEEALLIATLAGFPDRVARRREPVRGARGHDVELTLTGGGVAKLAAESVVRGSEFLVAVDAEERRTQGTRGPALFVRRASMLDPAWLLDLIPDGLKDETDLRWNAQAERVEVTSRLVYDGLVIDESRPRKASGEEAWGVLAEAALAKGPSAFGDISPAESLLSRVYFLSRSLPEAGLPGPGGIDLDEALRDLCRGRASFAEIREGVRAGDLLRLLRDRLTPEQDRLLAREAPERVTLAGGRQVRVNYGSGAAPYVASRIQDFFGMRDAPKIARGRVELVLRLLAPNQRPVQVTTDLRGFWERHYPRVRQELARRYPRHAWPADPLIG